MSSGTAVVMVMSNISTSKVKSTPASGALKMPAMAPAAPQPRSSFTPRGLTWKKRPTLEPMALPVEAMGASNPTLPPKATVRVEATREVYMLRGGSLPLWREIESSTLGMPWPMSPLTMNRTKRMVSNMPTRGAMKVRILPPPVAGELPKDITSCPEKKTTVLSSTAAKPLNTPTITLRSRR